MSKPTIVQKYEEQLAAGDMPYYDPVELDEIFHFYAEENLLNMLDGVLALAKRLHPDDVIVQQMDAEFELNLGDPALALEKLDKIYNSDHPFHNILRSAALAKLGRTSEAFEAAELALRDEDTKEFISYDIALGFMNAGMHMTALQYFKQSLTHHPDDVRTLAGLLFCSIQLKLSDEVPDIAERLIQLDPYNYEAWMAKGNSLAQKELFAEAIDAFDYAYAIAPDEADPLVLKAHCLDALQMHDQALLLLEEAVEKAEGEQLSNISLILAGFYTDNQQSDKAKDAVWTSVRASGGNTAIILRAAYAFQDIEAHLEAITMFEVALEQLPQDIGIRSNLAELYGKTEQFDKAVDQYKKIIELSPSAGIYALWAGSMMSQGKFGEAYRLLSKANQMEELWQTYILKAVCDVELHYSRRLQDDLRLAYAMCPDDCLRMFETLCPDAYKGLQEEGFIDRLQDDYNSWLADYETLLRLKARNIPKSPRRKKKA